MNKLTFKIGVFLAVFSGSTMGWALDNSRPLVSAEDDLITIRKISVLPATDNLQGIYSRPIENYLIEELKKDHHWNYVPANTVGPLVSPLELENDSQKVRQVSQGLNADAFLITKVTKGPKGVSLHLDLFLTKDAKLIAQARVDKLKQFDIKSLKEHVATLWSRIQKQLSYRGVVMSRQGNRVTVNLGKRDGVSKGTVVEAIQILKLKRHPKFNFLVGVEKKIIGKIKILKADDTLSFGQVILEKERGAIGKNTKLLGLGSVSYPVSDSLSLSNFGENPMFKNGSKISFGKNPTAWAPKKPPVFGQVGAQVSLGQYDINMSLVDVGSLNSKNNLYPSVTLKGELWITSKWTVGAKLSQGIVPVDNPRSGSSPEKLSQSLTETDLTVGYTLFSGDNTPWGTKVSAIVGVFKYRLYTDDSTPRAFTTMDFSGFKLGGKGTFPLTDDHKWSTGAYLFFFWNPTMVENPVSSGDDNDITINQFGLLCAYKLSEHLRLEASLDFAIHSSKFAGSGSRVEPATSASHRHTNLGMGIYYLF